jgi:hypothetical protein
MYVQAVCRLSEHYNIQLVLNSAGHISMGIVVQQDDAISKFTWMFVLDLGKQSSSTGSLMPHCSCLEEFATWYANIKL